VTEADDHIHPLTPQERTRVDALLLALAHWRSSVLAVIFLTLAVVFLWHDYVPLQARWIWSSVIFGNYFVQALVFWKLEREASLVKAMPSYMIWLQASLTISGLAWGSLPWLIFPAPTPVLVVISLFNLMLIFCLANAPSTPSMLICGIVPLMLLNASALALHYDWIYAGADVALSGMILLYGLRVQAAIHNTMTERHVAKDLAEELERHQQQLVKVERENALLLERQRLMYDMHDGLGATLLSALAAIEQRQLPQEAIVEALRGCVEDLRLVIDSLEPMEHNLVTLLATIRYRLGQRLDAAGLTLEWDIQDLPELPWLEPPDALHVLRLVQEALVNVLKHAHASCVRVATRDLGDQVEIHVQDNGCGFDHDSITPGRGLRSQTRRAERLGGELTIDSAPGSGTLLRLRLPVIRESLA